MLIMHIGFFACISRRISRTQSFQQNRHISFLALVALKLLVSLISRLVACSARIVVDRQTDRQTHTPRVNNYGEANKQLCRWYVHNAFAPLTHPVCMS